MLKSGLQSMSLEVNLYMFIIYYYQLILIINYKLLIILLTGQKILAQEICSVVLLTQKIPNTKQSTIKHQTYTINYL